MGYLGTSSGVSSVQWCEVHYLSIPRAFHMQTLAARACQNRATDDDVCHSETHLAGKQLKFNFGILETE